MAIIVVPQLGDNYAYLVVDDASMECAVIDCAEADKVIAAAESNGVKLVAVLTTHWHGDHSGGNADIVAKVPGIKVYGASAENGRIPALTNPVADGDSVRIGAVAGRGKGLRRAGGARQVLRVPVGRPERIGVRGRDSVGPPDPRDPGFSQAGDSFLRHHHTAEGQDRICHAHRQAGSAR